MTSDEKNETWWDDVKARGWVKMDHEERRTVERYGRWYAFFLPPHFRHIVLMSHCTIGIRSFWMLPFNPLGSVSSAPNTRRFLSSRNVGYKTGTVVRLVW